MNPALRPPRRPARRERWGPLAIRTWEADSGAPRLVCLPAAGSQAIGYRDLAAALPDWTVAAIDLPGHGDNPGPALSSVPGLAALVSGYLVTAGPTDVVLGHSFGGYLAYEAARMLDGHPDGAACTALLATSPPDGVRVLPPPPSCDDQLLRALHRQGGIPPQLADRPDLVRPHLPALREDLLAARAYQQGGMPAPPAGTRLVAIAGAHDALVTPAEVWRWRQHVPDAHLALVPGGHYPVRDCPADVAGALRAAHSPAELRLVAT